MSRLPGGSKAVLLFAILAMVGCSGHVTGSSPNGIWGADSTSAALDVKGGMIGLNETFTYDKAQRTLRFVDHAHPADNTVTLSSADDAKVRDQLAALKRSTDLTQCWSDAYDRSLKVTASSGSSTTYLDDSTAGCSSKPGPGPYIPMKEFDSLQSLFETLMGN